MALPLVRKNFVKRLELDKLMSHVVEEGGMRTYRNGNVHNHLTDGIIFQPNLPYVCGTDVNLLKWKYLDTVTIDVELLPSNNNDDEDVLRVGVLGEEQTLVDMTRFVKLPRSELRRLEADREETGSRIAEVGFDPTTGEWYYLTMRPDKIAPNHISTVLGTLLELAESLTTEELRFRMSVPMGARDTYRQEVGQKLKELLETQRTKNNGAASGAPAAQKKHAAGHPPR
jgi:mRNA guanylyltransferase